MIFKLKDGTKTVTNQRRRVTANIRVTRKEIVKGTCQTQKANSQKIVIRLFESLESHGSYFEETIYSRRL